MKLLIGTNSVDPDGYNWADGQILFRLCLCASKCSCNSFCGFDTMQKSTTAIVQDVDITKGELLGKIIKAYCLLAGCDDAATIDPEPEYKDIRRLANRFEIGDKLIMKNGRVYKV